jgi:hypothetical protein
MIIPATGRIQFPRYCQSPKLQSYFHYFMSLKCNVAVQEISVGGHNRNKAQYNQYRTFLRRKCEYTTGVRKWKSLTTSNSNSSGINVDWGMKETFLTSNSCNTRVILILWSVLVFINAYCSFDKFSGS